MAWCHAQSEQVYWEPGLHAIKPQDAAWVRAFRNTLKSLHFLFWTNFTLLCAQKPFLWSSSPSPPQSVARPQCKRLDLVLGGMWLQSMRVDPLLADFSLFLSSISPYALLFYQKGHQENLASSPKRRKRRGGVKESPELGRGRGSSAFVPAWMREPTSGALRPPIPCSELPSWQYPVAMKIGFLLLLNFRERNSILLTLCSYNSRFRAWESSCSRTGRRP